MNLNKLANKTNKEFEINGLTYFVTSNTISIENESEVIGYIEINNSHFDLTNLENDNTTEVITTEDVETFLGVEE